MSSHDLHISKYLKQSLPTSENSNINHFEFIRKQKILKNSHQGLFSNSLLKSTITSLNVCEDPIRKKLQKTYTPRKVICSKSVSYKRNKSVNPYMQAIEQSKKVQEQVLNSLKKSFKISKQSFSQVRGPPVLKESMTKLRRPKSALSLCVQKGKIQSQNKNNQKLTVHNPQSAESQRAFKSEPNKSKKRITIMNLSQVFNQHKFKFFPQSKLSC